MCFECTRRYWALEDEFYYPITPCDRNNDHIIQTIKREWDYHVNESEILVDDLQVLGALIPCRRAVTMHRNGMLEFCKALNCIREENNRMAIQRNKYFMLKELLSSVAECGRRTQSGEVGHIMTLPECKSDTECLMKVMNRST